MQALDAALKHLKVGAPNTAAMFLSVDKDNNKVVCLCQVPDVSVLYLELKDVLYLELTVVSCSHW